MQLGMGVIIGILIDQVFSHEKMPYVSLIKKLYEGIESLIIE